MPGRSSPSLLTRIVGAGIIVAIALIAVLAVAAASARRSANTANTANTIPVVAAENFYGAMLQQIGGKYVSVTSLLNNPNTDPHEFEASASTARQLSEARLVVKNGMGYDSWIDRLLSASPRSGRIVVSVGELLGHHSGDNPHVWYDPTGWTREANVIAADLARLDPRHRAAYASAKSRYLKSLLPVRQEIARIKSHAHGISVTATEPIFGYMAQALGFKMRNLDFQKAVMDGTDPSPQSLVHLEADLKAHRVRLLFYNSQTSEPVTGRVRSLAQQQHIPVVGVSELAPQSGTFAAWQIAQLKVVAHALGV